jgi:hypothetical protein
MLARPIEPGQFRMDRVGRRGAGARTIGKGRRPGDRGHQHQAFEDIGPDQGADRCHRGTEVVACDGLDRSDAERRDQGNDIPRHVQNPELAEVAVKVGVPAGRSAVAAEVGRDRPIAGVRQRR